MLTEEQVKHIAHLARMALDKDEIKKFRTQLTKVLDYVEILKEVKTDNVKETSQVTGLKNVMEEDQIKPSSCKREELLKSSELPLENNQIKVLPTIK